MFSGLNEKIRGLNRIPEFSHGGQLPDVAANKGYRLTHFGHRYIQRLFDDSGD